MPRPPSRLARPWHTGNGFRNLDARDETPASAIGTLRYVCSRMLSGSYELGRDVPLRHVLSAEDAIAQWRAHESSDAIAWLGHCAFLLRIAGHLVLTDPFLEGRVAPCMRALRRLPVRLPMEEISRADTVVLSHEHYDHLHARSLRSLPGRRRMTAIVPLGVGSRIRQYGFKRIIELDWFESAAHEGLEVTALPAFHYSMLPSNPRLWAGFRLRPAAGKRPSVYFMGDSGYGPAFARDVRPYGPFDLALLGIGAYHMPGTRAHLVHADPAQAVRIAQDIGARRIIGMHWGTVRMADEPAMEPATRLAREAKAAGFKGEALALRIGETVPLRIVRSPARPARR